MSKNLWIVPLAGERVAEIVAGWVIGVLRNGGDPGTGMLASPFWVDEAMPKGRFVETDDADPEALLVLLKEAGATLAGLRLPDGALVLRIARGRTSGQVRIP